jgi:hypothetical protein
MLTQLFKILLQCEEAVCLEANVSSKFYLQANAASQFYLQANTASQCN